MAHALAQFGLKEGTRFLCEDVGWIQVWIKIGKCPGLYFWNMCNWKGSVVRQCFKETIFLSYGLSSLFDLVLKLKCLEMGIW